MGMGGADLRSPELHATQTCMTGLLHHAECEVNGACFPCARPAMADHDKVPQYTM